ncbi:MAG TPA: hypothetical protein VHL58_10095 [Thermoanaerobaculia bacterium]|nr:hypothetical protein [Thermoanaerobaculia bacterium]
MSDFAEALSLFADEDSPELEDALEEESPDDPDEGEFLVASPDPLDFA